MSSSNKTSLGLNIWAGTDTPKREDFNEDNRIVDVKLLAIDKTSLFVPRAGFTFDAARSNITVKNNRVTCQISLSSYSYAANAIVNIGDLAAEIRPKKVDKVAASLVGADVSVYGFSTFGNNGVVDVKLGMAATTRLILTAVWDI